jgi:predicted TPR repeat methyltransferase
MREAPGAAAPAAGHLAEQAFAALERGDASTATGLLLRARALDARDPLIHYRLGLAYSDAQQPHDALAAYDAALALAPEHARAHNNRGTCLELLGRTDEAEQAFRTALEHDPRLVQPYLNLGHLLEARGAASAAVALYADALALGLDRDLFSHHLAAATGNTTARAGDAWVRSTFDNFAPGFDARLAGLGYDVPERLATLVTRNSARALDILDLGCGTGLLAAAPGAAGHRLTGVDLSEKMLQRARARNAYARLDCAEVHAWLAAAPGAAFDAVVAADVFIYIGALEQAFAGIAKVMRPGALFAFSVEQCTAGDYVLQASGRYAQSRDYLARLAVRDFDVMSDQAASLRNENGAPVAGRILVLARRA